jgi:hypothetical protein
MGRGLHVTEGRAPKDERFRGPSNGVGQVAPTTRDEARAQRYRTDEFRLVDE